MILDPDYARIFTQARCIAHQYGYAASLHGSYTRDLDILLTPWTEEARGNFEQIVRLIAQACPDLFRELDEVPHGDMKFTEKPNGRQAYSLHFKGFGDRRYVDISCMPLGGTTMAMRRINSGHVSRKDARALARIEFDSDTRSEHVGWIYLFHWAGFPA